MNKAFAFLTLSAMGILAGCRSDVDKGALKIDNSLTEQEISAQIFTPEVMWKMGRIGETALSPDGRNLIYTVTYYDMAANRGITSLYIRTAEGNTARLTDDGGSDSSPAWSADGQHIYFLSDRGGDTQLWRMPVTGGSPVQVSRVEGGIESFGIAPTGDKLFYVKRVQVGRTKSSDIYGDMEKSQAKIYDDLMARHWNYWDDGSYLHIFVAGFDGKSLGGDKDIMEGEMWDAPMAPYFDAAEIAWNNAGTALAYTCKKLTGMNYAVSTDSDIYVYDVANGTTTNICKTPSAPEGLVGYDKYPVFSPDDNRIAFRSMRRAGNESDKERLFVYDIAEDTFTDLTADFDYNAMNVVWDGNETIYFIAPIEATHQICRVGVQGGDVQVITSGEHDINAFVHSAGRCVASLTKISMATELFDVDLQSGALTQITEVNKPIYDNIKLGKVEKRWVPTSDGKKMLTWVIFPPDFDSNKKYPVLLYCQGGPQSVVSQAWSYRWNHELMASQGYIVVAPNRRGLPSFGQEWLDQISGDYSGQNIRDYLSAVDNVAAEPWADETRMGCVGASYGGYSSFYLMGVHQKRFKAFIAHCGIFNFESMYGATEELWFPNNDYGDSYWSENPVAKRSYANSPHRLVKNWDTPILIITGLNDFRVPYTQSLEAFTAARLMGLDARLVEFENEAHQVFKPQNAIVWQREFFSWLDKYVKNAK